MSDETGDAHEGDEGGSSPPLPRSRSAASLRRIGVEVGMPQFDLRLASRPPTPDLPETPGLSQMSKSLSFKSLRDIDAARLRASVWRPPHEERRHPKTLEQLWVHAVAGGSRAFLLAWGVRAGFNLVLSILKLRQKLSIAAIQRALFAKSAVNLGRVFAAFAFLWRFTFFGLRLYNVGPRGKFQQERWHAPLAGAIAGLCILGEAPNNRAGLAQQFLVRGLQGAANRAHNLGLLRIPHGNVLLFGAANAVIMGSFSTARETLDRGYMNWILRASHAPPEMFNVQTARCRGLPLPLADVEKIMSRKSTTKYNAELMKQLLDGATRGNPGPPFGPCSMHHPGYDSCLRYTAALWPVVFRWILPIYLGLNFVPPLVLRRKLWAKQPLMMARRSAVSGMMSSAFLATFVLIFQGAFCSARNVYAADKRFPETLRDLAVSRKAFWLYGFLTCGSLFFEDHRRRTELALYCLPKSMEALWNNARRRHLVPQHIPGGTEVLAASGMALLMDVWVFERECLSSLVRAVLWQVLGP